MSCTECGRGICPDCMTFGPVGIRCPDHASTGGRTPTPKRAARRAGTSLSLAGPFVTQALIAINVGIYLLELLLGGEFNGTGNRIYAEGALFGPLVAEGEWWRLITSAFLHYGLIHLGLNDSGRALELLGRARERRSGWMVYAHVDPRMDPLHITGTVCAKLLKEIAARMLE